VTAAGARGPRPEASYPQWPEQLPLELQPEHELALADDEVNLLPLLNAKAETCRVTAKPPHFGQSIS